MKAQDEDKIPVIRKKGRPTLYSKELVDQVLDFRENGMSISQVCAQLRISRQTYYNWLKQHQELSKANDVGDELHRAFHEEILLAGALGKIKGYNVTAHLAYMNNAVKNFDRTGAGQKASINIENMNVLNDLSDRQLNTKISEKLRLLGMDNTDEDTGRESPEE